MIVEHVFITTLDPEDAFRRTREFLGRFGFVDVGGEPPGAVEEAPPRLRLRRGRKSPARARTRLQLPQEVSLEHDRGRVTLVASIVPRPKGFVLSSASGGALNSGDDRHRSLLFGLARAVEAVLGAGDSTLAAETLAELEKVLEDHDRQDRRTRLKAFAVIIGAIALLGGFIVAMKLLADRARQRDRRKK